MARAPVRHDAEARSPGRPAKRAELIALLAELRPWLADRSVKQLKLFRSEARDQAGEDSDIGLIVEFDEPVGLAMFSLQADLAARLGLTSTL